MKFKILSLLILIGVIWGTISFFNPKGGVLETQIINFEVKSGENIWNTASKLKKEGLIESKIYFVWYVYSNDYRGKIKAGQYMLSSNLKIPELVLIFSEGDKKDEKKSIKITFPEGFSSKQMAERLGENGFDKEGFLTLIQNPEILQEEYTFLAEIPKGKNLEGYLFPDTYFFFVDASSEDIVKKMLDNFSNRLKEDLRDEIKSQGKTIYEVLTLASIIEKEVKTLEDKKIVSGLFYNRMEIGQAFQSCATLAFVLGENKKQYSYEDTQVESPYNTYLNPGLPPGPIANPGIDSIMATIYPTNTDYNYFLSNPETGETIFSKTIEEHNLNKDRNGL